MDKATMIVAGVSCAVAGAAVSCVVGIVLIIAFGVPWFVALPIGMLAGYPAGRSVAEWFGG